VLMIGDRLDLDIIPARLYGMKVLHFNRQHTRPNTAASPAGIPCIYDLADFR
jgi:FMN phosphatase YigB (HAD superfamily)